MRKINILLFVAAVTVVFAHCTDNVENVIPDPEDNIIPDTVATHITKEKQNTDNQAKKCIYLTIDDAPLNGSVYIDSVVTAEEIKTNIFLVGNPIDCSGKFRRYHEILQKNSHIEIYNHSYSHANNRYSDYYKNPKQVLEDFNKNQSDFGISHKIARLPGRNLWQLGERKKNCNQTGSTSAELISNDGYQIFGWDVEWNYDAKDYTPKQGIDELIAEINKLYESSRTFTANHVVLLMHDQMFAKVDAKNNLAELIIKLKENGYTFEHLSSYPEEIPN
ncbi:polysaccharide deacetylase family protein [Dysgonomonas sp. 520]|uniref:polysaccharide deacetylase family protein n=1 Tax=Dysgonomonas sp. 520 TaxID=2302931 RepID=UPI0013D82934|nr:polysaccharide deacetylase family protein [Dysgonomonas sp. 520]NDW09777.1 hypothetical protein [Dysgonomonas sp. 520]